MTGVESELMAAIAGGWVLPQVMQALL